MDSLLKSLVLALPLVAGCRAPVKLEELPERQTASGLAFVDLRTGDGPAVVHGSRVTVHYVGRYADGQRFDSSYDRGAPLSFTIGAGEVIRGWEEGMLGMSVGGERRITVPPALGFETDYEDGRALELNVELLAID